MSAGLHRPGQELDPVAGREMRLWRTGARIVGVAVGLLLAVPGLARSLGDGPVEADAEPLPLEAVHVLVLDPPKRAVVRLADAAPRVVEPGDALREVSARVVAVGADKITVDTVTGGAEPLRLRAWIFPARGDDAPRVLRLDPGGPAAELSPRMLVVAPDPLESQASAEGKRRFVRRTGQTNDGQADDIQAVGGQADETDDEDPSP